MKIFPHKIAVIFSLGAIVIGLSLMARAQNIIKSPNWSIENLEIDLVSEEARTAKIQERSDPDMPSQRTMFSKNFRNDDGTFSREVFMGPINYLDDQNNWQPIDTRIVRSTDPEYDYMNETNLFKTYFTVDPFGNAQNIKYQIGDAWMTFRSLSQVKSEKLKVQNEGNSKPEIKELNFEELKQNFKEKRTRKLLGLFPRYAPKAKELGYVLSFQKNKLRYAKILEATTSQEMSIDYSIYSIQFLEEMILTANQDINAISQEVTLYNVYAKQAGDSINFYHKTTNQQLWHLAPPVMYEYFARMDAETGNASRFENGGLHYEATCKNPDTKIEECQDLMIAKVIDKEGLDWLNEAARAYPVVIDLTANYDFSTTTNRWAYAKGSTQFASSTDYGTYTATTSDYTAVATSDSSRWTTTIATSTGQYDSQMYVIKINEVTSTISSIYALWTGYGDTGGASSTTSLQAWNNASSTWVQLWSTTFSTTTDQTGSGTISTNIASYINASSNFTFFVSTLKSSSLFANGTACTTSTQCVSNYCVDSYCCNTTCTTNCQSCNVAGSLGTCSSVTGWAEDATCTPACYGCNAGICSFIANESQDTYVSHTCTATHYRCNGSGSCLAPCQSGTYCVSINMDCNTDCACSCVGSYGGDDTNCTTHSLGYCGTWPTAQMCKCKDYLY